MKKKIVLLLAGVCAAAVIAGCSGKGASNQYIKISEYKGIEVEKAKPAEVTDEDVEAQILSVRRSNSDNKRKEVKDREAKNGDIATIDYTGKIDGKEFEGGSAKDQEITLGGGGYVDGFEEGILGHKAGETFDVKLTFPDNYGEHSNEDVVFTMTLKKLEEEVLPELNDEFVKKVSKTSKTVEEYKEEIKKSIQETNKTNSESENDTNKWKAVLNNTKVKMYPEEELKTAIEEYKTQMNQMLGTYYGIELDEYLKRSGMSEKDFEKQAEEVAKETLKESMAIELIAEKEKLAPSEKEMKKKKEEYAKTYGFEDVKAMEKQVGEDYIEELILQDIVKEWVSDNAKLVEKK